MKRLIPITLLLAGAGCGSIGKETPYAAQILNGGTGPFRLATKVETGIEPTPIGQMFIVGEPVGRAQLTDAAVFYEVAGWPTVPGTRDPATPPWEVDWNEWAPRRIARSSTHVVDANGLTRLGYQAGTDVLAPMLAWEVAGVGEPAIVRRPDGSVRLYYATAQGIGVAEAPSIDGVFTRLVTTPILPDVDGHGPAGSPAPVVLPSGETFMYVAASDAIYLARSTDGLAFTLFDPDTSTASIDPIALPPPVSTVDGGVADAGTDGGLDPDAGVPITEVGLRAPSALVTTSATGRLSVRLYFEVRRSDGTAAVAMAGSFDGLTFVRAGALAFSNATKIPTRPAPYLRPDGITLLTFTIPKTGTGAPQGVGMVGVAPGDRDVPPL